MICISLYFYPGNTKNFPRIFHVFCRIEGQKDYKYVLIESYLNQLSTKILILHIILQLLSYWPWGQQPWGCTQWGEIISDWQFLF